MNVIKKLFTDLESLLSLLVDFDYSKLILLAIILSIIYLINNIILNKYYKPGINKTKIELKKINLEAALYKKEIFIKNIFDIIYNHLFLLSQK
ncbi:hypothetical protein MASR2M54_02270 [Aliarcobacter cryaerophilus]